MNETKDQQSQQAADEQDETVLSLFLGSAVKDGKPYTKKKSEDDHKTRLYSELKDHIDSRMDASLLRICHGQQRQNVNE